MRDLTINLLRILNWNNTLADTKVQVQFISAHNRAHISHKSILGNFNENTLILNSAFKISYHQNQNKIICKVSIIKQHKIKELIGEAEIDLDCFLQRKVYFVTFQDHDKVLQIHKTEQLNQEELSLDMNETRNPDKVKISQEQFLQERYNFLQKISKKQSELKREFSQRVYNLLKDVKYARPEPNTKKNQFHFNHSKDYSKDNKYQNTKGRNSQIGQISKNILQQSQNFTPQKEQNNSIEQEKSAKKKKIESIKIKYPNSNEYDQNQNPPSNNYNVAIQKPKNMNLMINSLKMFDNDQKFNREKQVKLERQAILNQIKEDALMQRYYQREKRRK